MRSYRDTQRRLAALERQSAPPPAALAYVVFDADGELVGARDWRGQPVDLVGAARALARPGPAVKAYTIGCSPDDWPDAV